MGQSRTSRTATTRSQAAFTLIEVIVAMGLLSILVLGTVGMLANVEDQFFRLTLRQKAIFVLHGEVERLTLLYREYRVGTDFIVIDVDADENGGVNEKIFRSIGQPPSTENPAPNMVTDEADSVNEQLNGDDQARTATILVVPQVPVSASENWVWLDRGHNDVDSPGSALDTTGSTRRIVAKLWWVETDESAGVCAVAGLVSIECTRLTVSLNYPYLYRPNGDPADMPGLNGWHDTIEISTLVAKPNP